MLRTLIYLAALIATIMGLPTHAADPALAATGRITLTVRETAGIPRVNEVVRQGVPLAKSQGVTGTSHLVMVDGAGVPVPAEFVVLGRWNAGPGVTSAPIQWLLVAFPATVAAEGSRTYELVFDGSAGSNPPPHPAITLDRAGNVFTVDTGVARFTFGGSDGLLHAARNEAGVSVARGGSMTVTTTTAGRNTAVRSVSVEHEGPLYTSIIVHGSYDNDPVGGGGLGSTRRYVFSAGSPTVQVRHAVAWEGDLCPGSGVACDAATPDGLHIQRIRDTIELTDDAPFTVTAVGARAAPTTTGTLAASQAASLRQLQRPDRRAPLRYETDVAGDVVTGTRADGGLLSASTDSGTVAVAIGHFHRNEPQALRMLPDGRLSVDIADGPVWLASRQGLYATIAIAALPGAAARATLEREVWAPLNRPLHAWPSAEWFSQSQAVGELPGRTLPSQWADYGSHVADVIASTYREIDHSGLSGLTTFGLYPRYWGTVMGEEIDCGDGQDPTPGTAADDAFWCATWTDYHNTAATSVLGAMRTGNVEWIDDLAVPAALRMLHTQIQQCAPEDPWFYCGQAPTGYGGYRADFNSSHAYFENLFLYYWLTGDATVVDTITRGATTMRDYLCARRPATSCRATDPAADEWAQLTGRVASQWFAAFRFVGQSRDGTFLEDWRSGLARAVTGHYVEADADGVSYGFWIPQQVGGAGTYTTDQLWMASLYDMESLYRLQVDTDDAPIGDPGLRPSSVIAAWARTLVRYGARALGDGTAGGTWPNALEVRFRGDRIGGALEAVMASSAGGDSVLWNTGKANLTAVILRAARTTGDPELMHMGTELTRLAIDAAKSEGGPLSKVQGLYLARLHAAVARLSEQGNRSSPTPSPASTSTPTPVPSLLPTPAPSLLPAPSPTREPPRVRTPTLQTTRVTGWPKRLVVRRGRVRVVVTLRPAEARAGVLQRRTRQTHGGVWRAGRTVTWPSSGTTSIILKARKAHPKSYRLVIPATRHATAQTTQPAGLSWRKDR